jgi:hypothetical protein
MVLGVRDQSSLRKLVRRTRPLIEKHAYSDAVAAGRAGGEALPETLDEAIGLAGGRRRKRARPASSGATGGDAASKETALLNDVRMRYKRAYRTACMANVRNRDDFVSVIQRTMVLLEEKDRAQALRAERMKERAKQAENAANAAQDSKQRADEVIEAAEEALFAEDARAKRRRTAGGGDDDADAMLSALQNMPDMDDAGHILLGGGGDEIVEEGHV